MTTDKEPSLDEIIEHVAKYLPSQGPISVFVHHNTLHAFEELPFEQAVQRGSELYGCEPYLSEERYRAEFRRGRIRTDDLIAVLLDDLQEDADYLIGFMGTRFHLRLAMLKHELRVGTAAELRWLISETDALDRFRPETPSEVRKRTVEEMRRWILRDQGQENSETTAVIRPLLDSLQRQFGNQPMEDWSDAKWESVTLRSLWEVCRHGARGVRLDAPPPAPAVRLRDQLLSATGRDADELVNDLLIRFCAAYLDQGFSSWALPGRENSFWQTFYAMYETSAGEAPWQRKLAATLQRITRERLTPLQSIEESLKLMGVPAEDTETFIMQSLLALRGWAGITWQLETNADWAVRTVPKGTLQEFLAVRLILDRLAAEWMAADLLNLRMPAAELRTELASHAPPAPSANVDQRAYLLFQLAQVRGWSPKDLIQQPREALIRLVTEIETFNQSERRRIYHLAYERRYRNQTLDAVAVRAKHTENTSAEKKPRPKWQAITCIDDREESFRRHLEEVDPQGETFAAAAFYGVAMYFRSASDAHFRPLCPAIIKPKHYVTEEVAYSLTAAGRSRQGTRRWIGTAAHQWHLGSRGLWGGIVTAILGSLASIPMIARVLTPRLTSRTRRMFGRMVQPPEVTELHLFREEDPPGQEDSHLGYSLEEMANIVENVLKDIGLTRNFSQLVLFLGHGSGSLNNPHESAYSCGACSGGRGGPNARSFALMANDQRVRQTLRQRGLSIPDDTVFVGGYHDTCNEDVSYFDLDLIPRSHRRPFEQLQEVVNEARARNAHERCRRFESAPLSMPVSDALEHAQTRAEDLSQARPEYNHATDAVGFVGRRDWSRGLFLDRRTFLTSYDPGVDDENGTILARVLSAAIPVCAGISLEYYFSCVDPAGYGCGSKLPHNVTSLLGVMEGAASDLRTGLSIQMIEIHEPVRILFVIETKINTMLGIMDRNATIGRLVRNEWVQLATLDPDTSQLFLYQRGEFHPYVPEVDSLPQRATSLDWYRGQRDHLGYAEIVGESVNTASETEVA